MNILITIVFYSSMLFISVRDMKSLTIPLKFMYSALALSVVLKTLEEGMNVIFPVLSAAVLFVMFSAVYLSCREKLGFGDVQLSLLAGFYSGLPECLTAMWTGALTAVVFIAVLFLFKKDEALKIPVPFAPFMTAGCLIEDLFHITKIMERLFS